MKILILGDVMGIAGRKAINLKLPQLIKKNDLDFVIVNGENAADDGRGITKEIANEFFKNGVDVITSGNHIWDKEETINYIEAENRLLRPANLAEGSPGRGYEIYLSKDSILSKDIIYKDRNFKIFKKDLKLIDKNKKFVNNFSNRLNLK